MDGQPEPKPSCRIAGSAAALSAWLLLLVFVILCGVDVTILRAQTSGNATSKLKLDTGKDVYQAACLSCHGVDGKGAPRTAVGFDTRLPDFADCSFATKEPDGDWSATIHNGGPARGFSTIMPAFRDVLTDEQIDKVIGYMRGFCTDKSWPQGDLNLPRALVTEKAFPENEVVVTSAFNTSRTSGVGNTLVLEKRIGSSGQIEAAIPYIFTPEGSSSNWVHGFGDVALGYKQKLLPQQQSGSIFSVGGEYISADRRRLEGNGRRDSRVRDVRSVRPGAAARHLPAAADRLRVPDTPRHGAEGVVPATRPSARASAPAADWAARWTPMMEFIADRDLVSGAKTNWDVVPQLQIPLNKRMHILGNVGVRMPVNNTAGRAAQFMFYLLWDFADGSLQGRVVEAPCSNT